MPVTHDFNQMTASDDRLDLLVGFTNGAVQYLNPLKKEEQAVFNDDVSNNLVHNNYIELSDIAYHHYSISELLSVQCTAYGGPNNRVHRNAQKLLVISQYEYNIPSPRHSQGCR